jgi:type VI secretion system protein ImpB
MESSQKQIGRNRPPRVHITYDVDTGPATEKVELPFIMGVMADLSGDRADDLSEDEMKKRDVCDISERKFREVDAHTFGKFMKAKKPRVAFEVEDTVTGKGTMNVDLTFESMEDFSPAAIAKNTSGLKELFEKREALNELLTKVGKKPKLEKLLTSAVNNRELADQLKKSDNPAESGK